MRLNSLSKSQGSKTAKKRVGRGIGSGFGKTAGRGHKGQKSRTGGKVPAGFEGGQMPLQMRLPKFGFNSAIARVTAEIRLSELEKVEVEVIDLQALKEANIINNSMRRARVMLSGEITKAVTLKGVGVTAGAKAAIEAVGGKIEESE
jgi:large subunit ribosomal protein L15